jgi:8-oxo-dGTP pyrophosphatase MutT (NUDIX family)
MWSRAVTKIPVVSAILINPRGQVLLQQRDDRPDILCPGCWIVPGGMVEAGETPDQAIARELWEEMELRLPLTHWQTYEARRGHHAEITVVQHLYRGQLDRPAEDLPLHEGQQVCFFGPDEIDGLLLAFGFAATLRSFFSGV